MKLSEAMRERMLLSFELFPPKTEKGMDNLPGTIDHLMKYKPAYISCTYGAGGGNVGANREVCQMIKKAGTTPVTHFTVIKNTKEGIKEQLDQYLAEGVDHMLALRGDIPLGETTPAVISTTLQILLNLSVTNLVTNSKSQLQDLRRDTLHAAALMLILQF